MPTASALVKQVYHTFHYKYVLSLIFIVLIVPSMKATAERKVPECLPW